MNHRTNVLEILKKHTPLNDAALSDLEIGIYNSSLTYAMQRKIPRTWNNTKFCRVYENKARQVLWNLCTFNPHGEKLVDRIDKQEFPPRALASMRPENMRPDIWQDALDRKMKREMHIVDEKPSAMTSFYKCGKCKNKKCIYQELQLRSADEPMTIFLTCLVCSNKWCI